MLEDLGNIGDFVGGIAVILTLLYLAIGVRQNTSALNTQARQEIVRSYREVNQAWMNLDAAAAYARGLRDFPELPADELNLFATMFNDQALFFQGTFALRESGQLEEETYQAYLAWFCMNVATPGGTRWWEMVARPTYTPRMVVAVGARLAAGGLPDICSVVQFSPETYEAKSV